MPIFMWLVASYAHTFYDFLFILVLQHRIRNESLWMLIYMLATWPPVINGCLSGLWKKFCDKHWIEVEGNCSCRIITVWIVLQIHRAIRKQLLTFKMQLSHEIWKKMKCFLQYVKDFQTFLISIISFNVSIVCSPADIQLIFLFVPGITNHV